MYFPQTSDPNFFFFAKSHFFVSWTMQLCRISREGEKKFLQTDWECGQTNIRQEEGLEKRGGGYSAGCWRSLQYRSAESARAEFPHRPYRRTPTAVQRKSSRRGIGEQEEETDTSQDRKTEGMTKRRGRKEWSEEQEKRRRGELDDVYCSFLDNQNFQGTGLCTCYFWSPFNNSSLDTFWSVKQNLAFFCLSLTYRTGLLLSISISNYLCVCFYLVYEHLFLTEWMKHTWVI